MGIMVSVLAKFSPRSAGSCARESAADGKAIAQATRVNQVRRMCGFMNGLRWIGTTVNKPATPVEGGRAVRDVASVGWKVAQTRRPGDPPHSIRGNALVRPGEETQGREAPYCSFSASLTAASTALSRTFPGGAPSHLLRMTPLASIRQSVGQPPTCQALEIGPPGLPPFQKERQVIFSCFRTAWSALRSV